MHFCYISGYYAFKERYICPDCGKSYSARGNLSRHRRQECPYSPTAVDFRCDFCSYVTRRQDTLKKHIQTHTNPKDIKREKEKYLY